MREKSNELQIAIVQMELVNGEISTNMHHLEQLMHKLNERPADLIVLPEMWNTGFVFDSENDLDTAYEQGVELMRRLSEQYDCALYGSLLKAEEDGKRYNVALFVDTASGIEVEYRKRHLFGPGGEADHFTPGHEHKVVEWRGWRFSLSVCYDLRFPVWLRYSPSHQYDVMLNCANWPDPREDAWMLLLQARAMENQCYVVGCNRVGNGAGKLHYTGNSGIIDPNGKMVVPFLSEKEEIIYGTISMEQLHKVRKNKPFLADADSFEIK